MKIELLFLTTRILCYLQFSVHITTIGLIRCIKLVTVTMYVSQHINLLCTAKILIWCCVFAIKILRSVLDKERVAIISSVSVATIALSYVRKS